MTQTGTNHYSRIPGKTWPTRPYGQPSNRKLNNGLVEQFDENYWDAVKFNENLCIIMI